MGSGSSISISLFDKSYEYERDTLRRKLMEKFKEDPNHAELLSKLALLRSILTKHPEICRTAAREAQLLRQQAETDSSATSTPGSSTPLTNAMTTSKFSAFHELDRLYAIYETSNILKSVECRDGPIACPLGHYMAYFEDFSILREQVEALDEAEYADSLARGKNPISLAQVQEDSESNPLAPNSAFVVDGQKDSLEKRQEEKDTFQSFFGRKKNKERKPIVCNICRVVIPKRLETDEEIIEYNRTLNNWPPVQDYDMEQTIRRLKKKEKMEKKKYVKNPEEVERDAQNDAINKELKNFSFLNESTGSETPTSQSSDSSSDSSSETFGSAKDPPDLIPEAYRPLLSHGGGYHCSYCFYNLCDLCSKVYCHHGHEMKLWTHPEASLTCYVCKDEPITSGYKCIECPKMMKTLQKTRKLKEKRRKEKEKEKEARRIKEETDAKQSNPAESTALVEVKKKSKKKSSATSVNGSDLAFPTSSLTYSDLDICDYCTALPGRQHFQAILLREIQKYMNYIKSYQVESETAARIINDYENKIKTSTYLTVLHLHAFYLVLTKIKHIIKKEKKEYLIKQYIEKLRHNFFTYGLKFSFLFKKFYFYNYYYLKDEKKSLKKLIKYHKSLTTRKAKEQAVVSCPLGHAMKPFMGLPDQYKERQAVPLTPLQMKIINKYYKKTIKMIKKKEFKYKKILIKDSKTINFAIQKIMSEYSTDFQSLRPDDSEEDDEEDSPESLDNQEIDGEEQDGTEMNEEDIQRLLIDDVADDTNSKAVLSSLFLNYDDRFDEEDDEEEEQVIFSEERKKKSFGKIVEMTQNYPHLFQLENNKSMATFPGTSASPVSSALVSKKPFSDSSVVILDKKTKKQNKKKKVESFEQFNTIHLNNTSPLFFLLSQLPFPLIVTCSICQRVTSSGHHCDFCQYDLCEVCTPISCADGHQMTMWSEGESQEQCFLCSKDPASTSYKYNSFISTSTIFTTHECAEYASKRSCPTISSGYYCRKCDTHLCDMCTAVEGRNKIRANWEVELNELMRFIKSKQHDNNLAKYYAWRNNYNIVSIMNLIAYIKELKIVKSQIIQQMRNRVILEHLNLLHNNIVKNNNKIMNYTCLKSLDYYYNNKNLIFFNKKIIKQQFYDLIKLNKLFFLYKNNTSIKFFFNIACPLNHFMLKINKKNFYSIGYEDFFNKIDEFLVNKSKDYDYFNKDIPEKIFVEKEVKKFSRNAIVQEQELERHRREEEIALQKEEEAKKLKEEKELEYFFYNILPLLKTKEKKSKIGASITSTLNTALNNPGIKILTDKETEEEKSLDEEARETISLIHRHHTGKKISTSDEGKEEDADHDPTPEELQWRDKVIEERYMLPISPRMKELNHIYNVESSFSSNFQARVNDLPKHFASIPPTLRKEPLCNVCGIGVFASAEMSKKEQDFNGSSSSSESFSVDDRSLSFFHCALCNYNLCTDCSTVYCQYGHACNLWSHPEAYCLICNSCKQNSITSGYSCSTCCINLCNYCTTKDSRDSMMLIIKNQLVKLLYSIKIIAANNESSYAQNFMKFYHDKINKIIQLFDKTDRKSSANSYDLFSSTYYDNDSKDAKSSSPSLTSASLPLLPIKSDSSNTDDLSLSKDTAPNIITSVPIESLSASKLCKFLNIVKEAKMKIDEEVKEKLNQAKGRNYAVYSRDMI